MSRTCSAGLLLIAVLVGSACKPNAVGTPASPPQSPSPPSDSTAPVASAATRQAATLSYHCDGLEFTVRYEGDHVILHTPKQTYTLPQVRSADGAKFEGDGTMFWSKGEDAVVTLAGKPYTNCHEQLASEAPPAP